MARPLRIEYPGAVYHVSSRGNGRADIYLSDEDRELFMEVLEHVVDRFGWMVHAYCLMTNHYHLMIENAERKSYSRYEAVEWRVYPTFQYLPRQSRASVSGAL